MTNIFHSLATRGADFGDGSLYITYRNVSLINYRLFCVLNQRQQVILSVIGVPGALLAGYMVELPYIGRRGTLSISTSMQCSFTLRLLWELTGAQFTSFDRRLSFCVNDRADF
jgi:hypothetical protein